MTIIGTLAVTLKANTRKYKKGMKSARAITRKFALAVTAAGVATAFLVKSQFKAIDTIAKLSDRLNISTEAFTGLQHAAAITGVENAVFAKSMEKMLDSISKANQGLTTNIKAFDELGLSAKDLELLDAEQQFKAIADAMGGVKTATDRMRIARDIFGRGGAGLVNTLALGSKGLERLQADAVKLGITFTRFDASRVEAANDALLNVKEVFIGIGRVIAKELAPFVSLLADNFVNAGTEGEGMAVKIVKAFRQVAEVIAIASEGLTAFGTTARLFGVAGGGISNLFGGLSDRDLQKRVDAFKLALTADSPTQVVRDLFSRFDRDRVKAQQKLDMEKLLKSFGIGGVTGAGAAGEGISILGGLRGKLPAREVSSLRSINPGRGRQERVVENMAKDTKSSLVEEKRQTKTLLKMERLMRNPNPLGPQFLIIPVGAN